MHVSVCNKETSSALTEKGLAGSGEKQQASETQQSPSQGTLLSLQYLRLKEQLTPFFLF